MTDTGKRPTFVIELRPVPDDWRAPVERRLARLLKICLRGYGLRCVRVEAKEPRQKLDPPRERVACNET
jgi:hypothetical protein